MTSYSLLTNALRLLTGATLVLALAGCGMKGSLRQPAPPPADAALAVPPSLSPAPTPASQPRPS
ncbi:MAG: hypothetical protein ACO2ER_03685 [Castellaniella sp.]